MAFLIFSNFLFSLSYPYFYLSPLSYSTLFFPSLPPFFPLKFLPFHSHSITSVHIPSFDLPLLFSSLHFSSLAFPSLPAFFSLLLLSFFHPHSSFILSPFLSQPFLSLLISVLFTFSSLIHDKLACLLQSFRSLHIPLHFLVLLACCFLSLCSTCHIFPYQCMLFLSFCFILFRLLRQTFMPFYNLPCLLTPSHPFPSSAQATLP